MSKKVQINVHTPFTLRYIPASVKATNKDVISTNLNPKEKIFIVGLHSVTPEEADHWYTKAHAEVIGTSDVPVFKPKPLEDKTPVFEVKTGDEKETPEKEEEETEEPEKEETSEDAGEAEEGDVSDENLQDDPEAKARALNAAAQKQPKAPTPPRRDGSNYGRRK